MCLTQSSWNRTGGLSGLMKEIKGNVRYIAPNAVQPFMERVNKIVTSNGPVNFVENGAPVRIQSIELDCIRLSNGKGKWMYSLNDLKSLIVHFVSGQR